MSDSMAGPMMELERLQALNAQLQQRLEDANQRWQSALRESSMERQRYSELAADYDVLLEDYDEVLDLLN